MELELFVYALETRVYWCRDSPCQLAVSGEGLVQHAIATSERGTSMGNGHCVAWRDAMVVTVPYMSEWCHRRVTTWDSGRSERGAMKSWVLNMARSSPSLKLDAI